MTREEELDWLCRLRSEIYVYMPKEWLIPMNNALDMAISDLSENKGDLISRQAVLDELEKLDWQELYLPIHFKQILDDVPSANIMDCARAIKEYCKSKPDNVFLACMKCPFFDGLEKNEMTVCKLFGKAPHEWDLPEGEKGGEE